MLKDDRKLIIGRRSTAGDIYIFMLDKLGLGRREQIGDDGKVSESNRFRRIALAWHIEITIWFGIMVCDENDQFVGKSVRETRDRIYSCSTSRFRRLMMQKRRWTTTASHLLLEKTNG